MMDLTATNKRRLHRKRLAFLVSLTALFLALGIGAAMAAVGGVWNSKAPLGGEGFASSVIDGKIYVSHGYRPGDSTRLDIYDIATDTWTVGVSGAVARSELVGAAAGGRHYAIGGRFGGGPLSDVEVYNPGAGTWSAGAAMPTARRGLGAATIGDNIYVTGGSTGSQPHDGIPLDAIEVLDTTTNTWSALGALAPMPIPMMGVYSTVAWGGKVYVFGGFDGAAVSAAVQIYDPASDSWSVGAPMPTPRSNSLAGVCGRNIFVIGGFDGGNLAVNEAYNPSTNSWDTAPPMPTQGSEFAVSGVSAFGNIHAIGSGIFGQAQSIHEVYTCPPSTVGGATTFSTGDSGTSAGTIIGFAAVAAAVVALVASGAWYTRKRRQGEEA